MNKKKPKKPKGYGVFVLALLLSGCAGVKASLSFSKADYGNQDIKIHGTVKGTFSKVQEFRSLLESLEYRVTEKAK